MSLTSRFTLKCHGSGARLSPRVPRLGILHSTGVELKAHHRQRRLQPSPQAASLSPTLLFRRWSYGTKYYRTSVCTKATYYLKAMQLVSKSDSTYHEVDSRQRYRLYPSLMQIEVTMCAPVLVQQFTHLVCASQSFPSLIEKSPRLP